tara:strand:- start:1368 stop:1508 length:141 start_codon:yes stop_codon:yes gene_type:complete
MDWDKTKKQDIDKEMAFMAGSMQFLRKDLKSIQDKLRHAKKEKKDE